MLTTHVRTVPCRYVASLGQYAARGVQLHARWSLSSSFLSAGNPNPFDLASRDPASGALGVATDFWVAVLHKRLMGTRVLSAAVADDDVALLYAACTKGRMAR